jgi:hypothetical protein
MRAGGADQVQVPTGHALDAQARAGNMAPHRQRVGVAAERQHRAQVNDRSGIEWPRRIGAQRPHHRGVHAFRGRRQARRRA